MLYIENAKSFFYSSKKLVTSLPVEKGDFCSLAWCHLWWEPVKSVSLLRGFLIPKKENSLHESVRVNNNFLEVKFTLIKECTLLAKTVIRLEIVCNLHELNLQEFTMRKSIHFLQERDHIGQSPRLITPNSLLKSNEG